MRALYTLLLICLYASGANAGEPSMTAPLVDSRLEVRVGMLVVDIRKIDSVDQSFEATLVLRLSWRDPRLQARVEGSRTFRPDEIWTPRYQIKNEVFARKRFREVLEVAPDGTVMHLQRFAGQFSSRLDLREFPFDTQMLQFRLTFLDFEPERIEILLDDELNGMFPELTIPDWVMRNWHMEVDPIDVLGRLQRGSVVFAWEATRRTGYYVWKIILPLMLIVFMSWTVFWIDRENSGARIGVATSSMLTLIAYRFLLGNILPRVPYLTQLDLFILGSTILVFMALVVTVLTGSLSSQGVEMRAKRLDRMGQIFFPLSFGVLLVGVFLF